MTGKMAQNYDEADIIKDYPEGWNEKVGKYLPLPLNGSNTLVISSPAKRCQQTCKLVFGFEPAMIHQAFGEFDCAALGDRKFWEMTQDEFEKLVPLTPFDMQNRAEEIRKCMHQFKNLHYEHVIVFTHGMLIRYMYHFINHNPNISAYDVINSNGFEFSNLDLMTWDLEKMTTEVHRYDDSWHSGNCFVWWRLCLV